MKKKTNQTSDASKSDFSEAVNLSPGLREQIAQKAFELYEKRGWVHGLDVGDWLEAERLVLSEIQTGNKTRTKAPSKAETDPKVKTPLRERTVATKPGPVLGRP
ncbi:MAG: DUF2934 domain-containing protein [Nitrospirae bacterium]|nr:DUF2934 domain-containing protein [Nitrospirota bacterium]